MTVPEPTTMVWQTVEVGDMQPGCIPLELCLKTYPREASFRGNPELEAELAFVRQNLVELRQRQATEEGQIEGEIACMRTKMASLRKPQGLEADLMRQLSEAIAALERSKGQVLGQQIASAQKKLAWLEAGLDLVECVTRLDEKYPNSGIEAGFLGASVLNPEQFEQPTPALDVGTRFLPQWAVFSLDNMLCQLTIWRYGTSEKTNCIGTEPDVLERHWSALPSWRSLGGCFNPDASEAGCKKVGVYAVRFSGALPQQIWDQLPVWQVDFDEVVIVARADRWHWTRHPLPCNHLEICSVPMGTRLVIGLKKFVTKGARTQDFAWQLACCQGLTLEEFLNS